MKTAVDDLSYSTFCSVIDSTVINEINVVFQMEMRQNDENELDSTCQSLQSHLEKVSSEASLLFCCRFTCVFFQMILCCMDRSN